MKERIYICGYMGAGKSSLSKRLASKLGWTAFDLDDIFEEKYKIRVRDFFDKYDEPLFRKLESALLKETSQIIKGVIATGGGTPCFYDNMEWMNVNGITIFVEVSCKTAVNRILNSKKKRPLTMNMTENELMQYVEKHYCNRLHYYNLSQVIVKGESLDMEELLSLLKNKCNIV